VFRLLKDAAQGITVELPNTASVLPFLNLYTLVALSPEQLGGHVINTPYAPDLWVLKDGWSHAQKPPGAKGVARIYDVSAIPNKHQTPSRIPLPPMQDFTHQHYWRLPARARGHVSGVPAVRPRPSTHQQRGQACQRHLRKPALSEKK
jgi:hypothetical protein